MKGAWKQSSLLLQSGNWSLQDRNSKGEKGEKVRGWGIGRLDTHTHTHSSGGKGGKHLRSNTTTKERKRQAEHRDMSPGMASSGSELGWALGLESEP